MSGAIGVYIVLFVALFFEVFLLITFLERKPRRRESFLKLSYYPSATILVPCFNEEKTLSGTVESLLALEYPKDKLFISVIDDGSSDRTLEIARKYEGNPQVKVLTKENGGKYTALNLGIAQAQTELVGCLDADSFVAPDALTQIAAKFNEGKDVMAVTPAIKVYKPRNLLQYMQAAEYTFGIFYKKMFETLAAIPVLPGPFSIYRREVFEKVGLFKHAYNTEDMEIALRMQVGGLKIENAHTAYVYTVTPETVRSLIKQRTRWSQGFLQNSKDYKGIYFNPRYGHLGLLVMPFGLFSIFAALYMAGFALFTAGQYAFVRIGDMVATGIWPSFSFSLSRFDLYYVDTSLLMILVVIVTSMTLLLIFIGKHMSESLVGFRALLSYLILYGFIAPIWLAKAVLGAARGGVSSWR